MTDPSPLLRQLQSRDWWTDAMLALRRLADSDDGRAKDRAASYASRYSGERAASVIDVVASRQRRYETVVNPLVNQFQQQYPALTLAELARGVVSSGFGLPNERWETIISVAGGLERFRADQGLGAETDDDVIAAWATATEPLRLAENLDPYVGTVKGIGPALFAYLRMRSGADAVKPDSRLRSHLVDLGFSLPRDDTALILLAEAAAEEAQLPRLVLDQLLW